MNIYNWSEKKIKELEFENNKFQFVENDKDEKSNNIIFIYTPPKVGSTTLVSSLRLSVLNYFNIFHIHNEKTLKALKNIKNVSVNEIIRYNNYIGKNVYVIDVYRNPIERKISDFFENLSSIHFNNTEENINNYNIYKLINRFNKLFPHIGNEDYFKEIYDIPIADKFDFENNYLLENINGIKYIKLRLNDSKKWSYILSSILKKDVYIINDYSTENKTIGYLYKKFKEKYILPLNYYELIKNSPEINYYLNENEKIEYLNNWKNKTSSEIIEPYSDYEYNFYLKLSLENSYNNKIQREHYFDSGCICFQCCKKRNEELQRVKKGEKMNSKILHTSTSVEQLLFIPRK